MFKRALSFIVLLALVFSFSISCGMYAFADEVAVETNELTGKLILKEDFEKGLDSWTVNSGEDKISIVEKASSDGTSAFYAIDDKNDATVSLLSQIFIAKEKESYTLSFDVKNVSGNSMKIYLRFLNSSDKIIFNKGYGSELNEWVNVKESVVAPSGSVKGQLLIVGGSKNLSKTYFDNIVFTTTHKEGGLEEILPSPVETNEETGNLLFKEDFENGISKWTVNSGEDKIRIEKASDGDMTNALFAIDDSKESAPTLTSKLFSVSEDESYTVAADFKNIEGSSVKIYLRFMDKSNAILYNKAFGSSSDTWKRETFSAIAPKNSIKGEILVSGYKAGLSKTYIDNITVTTTTPLSEIKSEEELYKVNEIPVLPLATESDVIFADNFEDGLLPHWEVFESDVRVEVTSEEVFEGKKALVVQDTFNNQKGGVMSPYIKVEPEQMHTLTADIYTLNEAMRVYIKYFDKDYTQLSSVYVAGGDKKWEKGILSASAPAGSEYIQVWAFTTGGGLEAGYVDNLKLYKGLYKEDKEEKPFIPPVQKPAVDAKIVAPVDNKLVYNTYSDMGDTLSDFSYSGFYKGEYNLPVTENLKVSATLSPSGTYDDTELIQAAVDKAYGEVSGTDMRVVKLKAGRYNISSQGINLHSGVILSGEGQGPTGTILYAKDAKKHSVVKIIGKEPTLSEEKIFITDDYVKSGSKSVSVSEADAKKLKVGDQVIIHHPSTDEWAYAIGMKGIKSSQGKDSSWDAGEVNMTTERIITKIEGTKITFDFGFFVPYMKEYTKSYITKIISDNRIENAGVENLRMVSYYNGNYDDEQHATVAVSVSYAKNIFVRDITAKHFYGSLISSGKRTKQVTALNCSSLEPVSQIAGSRRYTFACSTSAQQILYTGCYSFDGRHDYETSFEVTGPISFVDNVADSSNSNSETHGTWSTGVLYDNLYQIKNDTKGLITLVNRGIYGSSLSQGWSAAGSVIWNSLSPVIIAHDLPLNYQNFVVGTWGHYNDADAMNIKEKNINSTKNMYRTTEHFSALPSHFVTDNNTPVAGDAYFDSIYTPVNPHSLFKAQLSERFTGNILASKPNAPIIVKPECDGVMKNGDVTVSGVYKLGAKKVTVYIDNIPYEASLNEKTCEFSLNTSLSWGVHKIYATQTVGNVEGNKTADRFVTVGKASGNPDYLQSIYESDKTSMLVNDPRPTFDKVIGGVKILVNGKLLYSDVLPVIENGRTLVPMRAIFEAFGANVEWNPSEESAFSELDGTRIKILKNKTTAYKNDEAITLDVPATILNGRFVVPVRFISEAFGAKVDWIDSIKTVIIEK